MNTTSYLLANAYSAFSPASNLAAVCSVNGQSVACPQFVGVFAGIVPVVAVIFLILMIISMWKIFLKAGQPGWAAIIPIYNIFVLLQIVRKPIWWIVLFFVPFVSFIMSLVVIAFLGKSFGKGFGFILGLIFLPFIFYPILAFGDSAYMSGMSSPASPMPPMPPSPSPAPMA